MNRSIAEKKRNNIINATVSYTPTHFVVKNNDKFDWANVKMEAKFVSYDEKFIYKTQMIRSGQTYMMSKAQFLVGTVSAPSGVLSEDFFIFCNTPYGNGFWFGTF